MRITLGNTLPPYPDFVEGIRRAPDRGYTLTPAQTITALKNALRYIPTEWHEQLAPELMEELRTRGRIYGYRFRPAGDLKAKPIDEYRGQCIEGKAFQVMIDNNLCFDIALYPYELVTYGETGQVCQNWMQYRLIKQYLEELTQEQTLVIESGHPLGLFRSRPDAPRVIITNSMMIGQFDNQHDWHIAAQMGVANYGQMTAGGWMYIGPQGIVHGTFNTLLNAGRLKLGIPQDQDLRGHLFVSSGLGGMSGAQPKAAEIAGAVSIIAEVDSSRIETRHRQGWVGHVTADIAEAYRMASQAMQRREPCSIAYHGNVVDLLEYAERERIPIELLSDQTSCHAVYEGGYCPVGLTFEERTRLLHESPEQFRHLVDISLHRHFEVIKKLVARGTYFFDYGNSFMKAIYDAGVKEISYNGVDEKDGFAQRIKSKVEQGIINMCSVSIDVITSSDDTSVIVQGQRRPTIIECELREVSIVDIGSNRNAVRLFDACDGKEICLSDNSGDNFLLPLLENIHKDNHMELKEMKDLLGLRDKEDSEVKKEILRLRDLDREVVTLRSEKQQLEEDLRAYRDKEAAERQRAIVKLVDDAVEAYKITASEKEDYIALAEKDYERTKKILDARSGVQQPSVSQTDENNVWQQRFRQIEESNQ